MAFGGCASTAFSKPDAILLNSVLITEILSFTDLLAYLSLLSPISTHIVCSKPRDLHSN